MPIRRAISTSGDYSLDATGAQVGDSTQVPNVILAVRTTLGSVPSAPRFGKRRTSGKLTAIGAREEEAATRDALAHLVASGQIWALVVTCTPVDSALETVIAFEDGSGAQELRI